MELPFNTVYSKDILTNHSDAPVADWPTKRAWVNYAFDELAAVGGKVANWGMIGGFLLGVLFALAFCPYSAVLYFGILMPLALKTTGGIALPAIFALGTGLPVLIIGTLLSFGVAGVSNWLNTISRVERIIRMVVAVIFIGVGIYYVVLWIKVL